MGSTRIPGSQVLEVFETVFKFCGSSESCPLPPLETFGLVFLNASLSYNFIKSGRRLVANIKT